MPIHFLGLKESFEELSLVKDIIRSCDTAQMSIAAKYHKNPNSLFNWTRAKNETIELENDYIPEEQLEKTIKIQKEWISHKIL